MHEFERVWTVVLEDEEYKKQAANPAVIGSLFTLKLSLLMLIFVLDLSSCN